MYLLTNVITNYAYDSNATSTSTTFSASMFRVHECTCIIKFLLGKWHQTLNQIFVVVETVFFHSICRYHLDICRPEFYKRLEWC